MNKIKDLHPRLQYLLEIFQEKCKQAGYPIKVTVCVRTVAEQNSLYAQGRTKKGNIVTKAKGNTFSSMHQWGIAFDICRADGKGSGYYEADGFFNKVGKIGKSIGLEWGGDWSSYVDLPHFQLPDWGSGVTKLKNLYGKPNNFFASWESEEMTVQEKKEFEQMKQQINELMAAKEKVYHYTSELPDWARPTIQRLLNKGVIHGESASNLNLTYTQVRIFVANDNAGFYK